MQCADDWVVPPKSVPPAVRGPGAARPSIDGERPLAWANDRSGRWYVGTDRALHLATRRRVAADRLGAGRARRLATRHLDARPSSRSVAWGEPEPRTDIELDDPGQLLELLRERVTKSVVVTIFAARPGPRRPVASSAAGLAAGDGPSRLVVPARGGSRPGTIRRSSMSPNARSQEAEQELAGL